jgi:hypothetical protein
MYLGAQVTQMLLDGVGPKNYLVLIRHLHQQVVSDSPLSVNSDAMTRLGGALDVSSVIFCSAYTDLVEPVMPLRVYGIR